MMRHRTTLRVVSSPPAAARVAATALLAAVALAMLAAPALAGTASHRSHSSARSVTAHPTSSTAPNPAASPRATAPGGSGTLGQRSTSGTGSSSRLILRAALVGAVITSMLTAGLFVFGAKLRRASGPKVQPSRSTGHDQTDHSPEPDSYPARLAGATEPAASDAPTSPTAVSGDEHAWPDYLAPAAEPRPATVPHPAAEPHDDPPLSESGNA